MRLLTGLVETLICGVGCTTCLPCGQSCLERQVCQGYRCTALKWNRGLCSYVTATEILSKTFGKYCTLGGWVNEPFPLATLKLFFLEGGELEYWYYGTWCSPWVEVYLQLWWIVELCIKDWWSRIQAKKKCSSLSLEVGPSSIARKYTFSWEQKPHNHFATGFRNSSIQAA